MTERFNVDDILILHSPHSGNDSECSFRGYLPSGSTAIVVLGKREPDPHGEEGETRFAGSFQTSVSVSDLRRPEEN